MGIWGLRVVAIGDDPATLSEAGFILGAAGADVIAEPMSGRALATILGVLPDVVLLEATSPPAAEDLIRTLRTLCPERGGRIPVIALGEASDDVRGQAVLPMPLKASELVATVEALACVAVERRTTDKPRAAWPTGVLRNRRWTMASSTSTVQAAMA